MYEVTIIKLIFITQPILSRELALFFSHVVLYWIKFLKNFRKYLVMPGFYQRTVENPLTLIFAALLQNSRLPNYRKTTIWQVRVKWNWKDFDFWILIINVLKVLKLWWIFDYTIFLKQTCLSFFTTSFCVFLSYQSDEKFTHMSTTVWKYIAGINININNLQEIPS